MLLCQHDELFLVAAPFILDQGMLVCERILSVKRQAGAVLIQFLGAAHRACLYLCQTIASLFELVLPELEFLMPERDLRCASIGERRAFASGR